MESMKFQSKRKSIKFFLFLFVFCFSIQLTATTLNTTTNHKKIAYLVSDMKIPFWRIISDGIKNKAKQRGYEVLVYSAENLKEQEIKNTISAINSNVDALIISPINSSTSSTVLRFAKSANVPVVICDIGTDKGEYLSFISSDNKNGAYKIGKILSKEMIKLKIDKNGSVGIIAIPQQRSNGKERTQGFKKAMSESEIKIAGLLQQKDFTYEETYRFTKTLIKNNPNLKALWIQTSNRYQAVLDAIKDSKKSDEILLVSFDAEPEFLDLIPKRIILASAMQQPFYMGEKSVETLFDFFDGKKVIKDQKLDILEVSTSNIEKKLPLIKRDVLGILPGKTK